VSLCFRIHGPTDPVLVTMGESFAGVFLPLRQGREDHTPRGRDELDGLIIPEENST
jgi:hypothetical protein